MSDLPRAVVRHVAIAYAGLCLMAARGLQLRAAAGAEALAPWLWAPGFLAVGVSLLAYAAEPRSRVLCLVTGLGLHLLVAGRIAATAANDNRLHLVPPGGTLTGAALYGVVLLSSALVWRYLLWPLTLNRR